MTGHSGFLHSSDFVRSGEVGIGKANAFVLKLPLVSGLPFACDVV